MEEESQRNNIPHLKETFSILTLTCNFVELSEGVSAKYSNRLWAEACGWVYFRHATSPVRTVRFGWLVCA